MSTYSVTYLHRLMTIYSTILIRINVGNVYISPSPPKYFLTTNIAWIAGLSTVVNEKYISISLAFFV